MDSLKYITFPYDIFLSSPGRAVTTALAIWTIYAIFYKLVIIGLNRSLGDMIMRAFQVDLSGNISIHELSTTNVGHNTGITVDGHTWEVKNVFLAYYALGMMRVAVITATSLAAFSAMSIFVMNLAQPVKSISMEQVAETLGFGSTIFLVAYVVISLLKILSAIHKMPVSFISDEKDYKVILFSL